MPRKPVLARSIRSYSRCRVLGDIQCVVVAGSMPVSLSGVMGSLARFSSSELRRDVVVGKVNCSVGEGVGLGSPDREWYEGF
jgi:hypothetical protein